MNEVAFETIAEEIMKAQIGVVLGWLILWTAIGLIGGVVLGFVVCVLLGRMGAWKLDWQYGRILRVLNIVWLVLAFGACGAWIGKSQGVLIGVDGVVKHSQFHDEILMPVGEVTADGMMIMDLSLKNIDRETYELTPLTEEQNGLVQAFQEGRVKLNVKEFQQRVVMIRDHIVDDVVAELEVELKESTDLELEGLPASLRDRLLQGMVQHAFGREAEKRLGPILDCYRTLPEAADDGGMVSRTALAAHIVDRGAVPVIMQPTQRYVRGTQISGVVAWVGLLIPPLLIFWLIRRHERHATATDTAGEDSPEHR